MPNYCIIYTFYYELVWVWTFYTHIPYRIKMYRCIHCHINTEP